MNLEKYLIVLAGPTSVGKTELAIRLALHFHTEIISADSRQFYKEMTIGTAKPTQEELTRVPHYFINNLSIEQEYTAGMYEQEALELLDKLFQKHDAVVLVGGSGLFIKALCEGLDDIPEVEPEIRMQLNQEFKQNGLSELLKELQQKDPNYYEKVDRNNPVRIIRALEICRGTGMPFSSFRTAIKKQRPFKIIQIGLNRDREELYERINLRIDQMLSEGLLEEARSLYKYKQLNALQTVGYSEVFDHFEGKYDYEEMVRLLKQNSRHYAKRQLTWFTKDKNYHWFHPSEYNKVIAYIETSFKKTTP